MLKFMAKVAAQQALSTIPNPWLYHRLQDMTGSRTPSQSMIQQKVEVLSSYMDLLGQVDREFSIADAIPVDIGAGWHLTIPLLLWQLGVDNQHVSDVARHARPDSVFGAAKYLASAKTGLSRRMLPEPGGVTLDAYLERLGIRYHAPCVGPLPVKAGGASLVMLTQILYFPPADAVRTILEEAARLLRPGGYLIATIHLFDTYSAFDTRLPPHNFLRYSGRVWERWFNSPHISYNRLRPSDYEKLFAGLPFEKSLWDITPGTQADLEALRAMPPHAEFAGYSEQDLAARHLTFIMRRT